MIRNRKIHLLQHYSALMVYAEKKNTFQIRIRNALKSKKFKSDCDKGTYGFATD